MSLRMRSILPHDTNPHLRETAREIPLADIQSARITSLIADMKKLLAKEEYGVALAASQVGEPLRLFIVSGRAFLRQAQDEATPHRESMDLSRAESKDLSRVESRDLSRAESRDQVYINPEIIKMSREKKDKHEGCLSIRGFWGEVPRAEKATIRAYDEAGRPFTRGASGFLAHIFQHEMDHLEGILYTDKATTVYEEKRDDA